MAEWAFGMGSSATGYLTVNENWNSSTQVSLNITLRVHKWGAWYSSSGGSWNGNVGGVTGSGAFNYSAGDIWYTLWGPFNYTYNKDANGYINIGCYAYANGDTSGVGAGSTSQTYSPARIGVAPTIVGNTADQITPTGVRLGTEISSIGLGTSAATRMYYKTVAAGSWTQTSDQNDVGGYNYWTITGLTPNTKYYRLARWWNNNNDTSDLPWPYPSESYYFVTLANGTIGTVSTLATTASIPATVTTGHYTPTSKIQYKVQGSGTWLDSSTSTSGTPTFNLSGLLPNTTYDYRLSVTTTSGTWDGSTATLTTLPAGKLVYSDGQVKNAIPRRVNSDGSTTMVNINIVS